VPAIPGDDGVFRVHRHDRPHQDRRQQAAPIKDAAASVSFHHKKDPNVPGDVDEDRYICADGHADANATAAKSPGCTNPSTGWTVTSSSTGAAYILNSASENRLTFEVGTPYTLGLITSGADGEAYG